MAKNLFHTSVTAEKLGPPPIHNIPSCGSHVFFAGTVRDSENSRPIMGIEYSVYSPMAEKTLRQIAREGAARFPEHGIWIEHRSGFVPAGEPSLHLLVTTPHSREGFEIAQWYLREIKTRVPIWKNPRFSVKKPEPLHESP